MQIRCLIGKVLPCFLEVQHFPVLFHFLSVIEGEVWLSNCNGCFVVWLKKKKNWSQSCINLGLSSVISCSMGYNEWGRLLDAALKNHSEKSSKGHMYAGSLSVRSFVQ